MTILTFIMRSHFVVYILSVDYIINIVFELKEFDLGIAVLNGKAVKLLV